MKNELNPIAPSHDDIAQRAYFLWEQAGGPAGRDQEFWLCAEAELAATTGSASVPPVIAPPAITSPPTPTASPALQVPPPIKSAVKSPGRRPPLRRNPKTL